MQISNSTPTARNRLTDCGFSPASLVDLLRRRAAHQADKQGYTFLADGKTGEACMTYGDLDLRARALGAWLQSLGMTDKRVLLLFPSGLEYITAFFGCLYAGAVAVPAYPPRANRNLNRIQAIYNDARPSMILTTDSIRVQMQPLLDQATELRGWPLRTVDDIGDDLAGQWQEPDVTGHSIAFLQYTSGSTAAPKGVMISHDNLLHNERMIEKAFRQTEQSVIVGWLPLFHDMGLIGNVLQTLYIGARCVLLSPQSFLRRPMIWIETVSRYRATTSGGPNFAYELCARRLRPEQSDAIDLSSWTTAFSGAEPVRQETLERFAAAFEPFGFRRDAFYPCYGLAEATLFVSGGETRLESPVKYINRTALEQNQVVLTSAEDGDARSVVSCGKAWLGQRIRVVDSESFTECRAGRVGEIWVSGPSVAQGYWGRLEESASTFRAYIAASGEGPFMRTGDLGFIGDGELYITGRLKDLIIIHGRNHYPQDIELTVERCHPGMRPGGGAAFSVDVAGEERLIIVQEIERQYRHNDLGEIVGAIRRAVVEEHDIPAYGVILCKPGSVPKTSSGKVQHQACRAAYISGTLSVIESSVAGPSDYKESDWNQQSITREEILASGTAQEGRLRLEGYLQEQVARVLELAPPQVPLRQSLTSLGLDSLKSMELQNSIETGLDVFLPMASFLQDTNISELATLLMAELEKSIPGATLEVDRSQDLRADRPLSFGQQRLWFLDQLEPGNPAYNISTAFRFDGQLNAFALVQAIAEIVARHEALRTTFRANRGEPAQIISPLLTIMLPVVDLASIAETALDSQSIPLAAEEARRKFDLLDGPLIRTTLVRRSEQDHILFLTLHHIVSDAWSLGIFLRELEALYTAYARGNPSPLPELPAQYLDFAVWQRQRADALRAQLSFWKQTFITPPAQLELPLARPRPVRPTSRGACHWLTLSGDLSDKLKALSRQENCTLFMTLLAGFYVVLHGYTGQSDISLGSPIAGRNRAEFEKLIGFFVNTLILRADLSGNPTFRQLLGRVRQLALQSYANQDLPFEQVVSAVAPDRNTDHSPLYSVWFGLHAGSLPTLTLPAVDMIPIETDTQTIKVDLAVHLSDNPEGIAGKLEYNKDLFEAATIASLSEDFESVLTGATAQPDLRLNALEASLLVGVRRHRVREAENYENALHQKLKSTRRRVVPG